MRVAGGARWPRDQGWILILWVRPPQVERRPHLPWFGVGLYSEAGAFSTPGKESLPEAQNPEPQTGFCLKLHSTSGTGTAPLWGARDRAALCQSLW